MKSEIRASVCCCPSPFGPPIMTVNQNASTDKQKQALLRQDNIENNDIAKQGEAKQYQCGQYFTPELINLCNNDHPASLTCWHNFPTSTNCQTWTN